MLRRLSHLIKQLKWPQIIKADQSTALVWSSTPWPEVEHDGKWDMVKRQWWNWWKMKWKKMECGTIRKMKHDMKREARGPISNQSTVPIQGAVHIVSINNIFTKRIFIKSSSGFITEKLVLPRKFPSFVITVRNSSELDFTRILPSPPAGRLYLDFSRFSPRWCFREENNGEP